MRHRDGDIFMWHGDRLGCLRLAELGLRQCLDDRCKIGAGIAKQILNAAIGEHGEIGFGGGVGRDGLLAHDCRSLI